MSNKDGKNARKTAATPPTETEKPPLNAAVDEAAIAELAYRRWLEKGCPQGSAEEDWLEAEKELRSQSMAVGAGG